MTMQGALLAMLLPGLCAAGSAQPALVAGRLRCEYLSDPLGIDAPQPRLSWWLSSEIRGQRQTSYQVLVASSLSMLAKDQGDLWDSGKTPSDESSQISYAGRTLVSAQRCFWKVRVWDKDDRASPWSAAAEWTMGLLTEEDWHAKWIAGAGPADQAPNSLPLFRRTFAVTKPVDRAVVFICGLGQFELHVNGVPTGQDVLQPGWTNYRKTCLYVAYDITAQLRPGTNALGVLLGNGMYTVPPGRYSKFTGTFGPPKLIAQVRINYADGTGGTIGTDDAWKTSPGPITFSSIYGGEDYDARLEQRGWDAPAFDDSGWRPALLAEGPGGTLAGSTHSAPPIRVAQALRPKAITEPRPGIFVCDLGQNCAILPRMVVQGPAGAKVRLTPGELLNGDGTVSQASSGGPANFNYTLAGRGEEKWGARFTYYGSRYWQVEGAIPAGKPNPANGPVLRSFEGDFITSSVPAAGEFSCSNDMFNRTAGIIRWAMRSNAMSILTDCPHRERLGWLEETHLVGPSLMDNFEIPSLFNKICADMRDSQLDNGLVPDIAPEYPVFGGGFRDSPEWGSACVLVPWQLYQWYGDVAALGANYETMKRYVAYLGTQARDHIVSHGLGDWYDLGPRAPGQAQLTPTSLTATAFYYRDIVITSQAARRLGHEKDADELEKLALEVREAFNKTLYDPARHTYATGSQTANAIPSVFGLAPEADAPAIVENIVQDVRAHHNGLTSGDIGYRYLLRALADGGRSDVIFDMNSRSDRPGYGFILAKGATSLTEGWDGSSSQDHFMLGHIMEWFYSDLAGIKAAPGTVAFKKILIEPTPVGDVTSAEATCDSVRGPIVSRWKMEGSHFALDVSVPVGASASVRLPFSKSVTEGGRAVAQAPGVRPARQDGSATAFEIESGRYHFAAER